MPDERFAEHLTNPCGRGHVPAGSHSGAAGGAACGDLVHLRVAVAGDRVADAGFEASGCGATIAAASAAVDLVRGAPHRALGAAARADARIAPSAGRTLVAMSGGVDSAVAALEADGEAVAVTLELWRDPENDG